MPDATHADEENRIKIANAFQCWSATVICIRRVIFAIAISVATYIADKTCKNGIIFLIE